MNIIPLLLLLLFSKHLSTKKLFEIKNPYRSWEQAKFGPGVTVHRPLLSKNAWHVVGIE